MAASLRTIEATVSADGVVTLAEPVTGPCRGVLTLLIDDWIPNPTTLDAINEPSEELHRYRSPDEAIAALGI